MLSNLIGSMILVIVGYSLVGPLNHYGYYLGFVFFGVTILIAALMFVVTWGYVGYSQDYEEQPQELKKKKHKQTYFEYVKERLAVEKVMK